MSIRRSVLQRTRLLISGFAPALMTVVSVALCPTTGLSEDDVTPNVVIQWNNAALQGVRDSSLGPPMVARALFIVHNCIYDAWAAYDKKALGTVFGASLRRLHSERTLANKNQAISFAAYLLARVGGARLRSRRAVEAAENMEMTPATVGGEAR